MIRVVEWSGPVVQGHMDLEGSSGPVGFATFGALMGESLDMLVFNVTYHVTFVIDCLITNITRTLAVSQSFHHRFNFVIKLHSIAINNSVCKFIQLYFIWLNHYHLFFKP